MCGICGVFDFNKLGIVDKNLIKSMTGVLSHRGPDRDGIFIDKTIGLGHRRLSVIDLSDKANQPMSNEDGSVWVTFNGEIYNFKEIRRDLEKKAHEFKSNSDTEVIVHAYEEYGEDCVKRFSGIFAFAIWDSNKRKLVLARDHLGVKPLYYAATKDFILFASEIKSILLFKDLKFDINKKAADYYLTLQYIPAPETIFNNIKKLEPGQMLICEKNKISFKNYWDLKLSESNNSEEYYSKNIRQMLEGAVKSQLISDVPIGAFLSGGVDSSILAGIMSKSQNSVKTFCVGFESEDSYNELKYAKLVADHFNTDHHELLVNSSDIIKSLPKVVWQLDEPMSDFAAIPTYLVSKFSKKKVTVALSGEGADELFAGYPKYSLARVPQAYQDVSRIIKGEKISGIAANLISSRRIKKMLKIMSLPETQRYLEWDVVFNEEEKKELYKAGISSNYPELVNIFKRYFERAKNVSPLSRIFYADIKTWLPEDLLMKVDKMSMLASLEARVPYLDHNFVQFAANIPSNLKIKGMTSKYILKKAFKDLIPRQIIEREKHGFNLPISPWFRSELKDMLPILTENRTLQRGYFNKSYIDRILNKHMTKKENYSSKIWSLLTFEIWNRIYIDGEKPKAI